MGSQAAAEGDEARPVQPVRSRGALVRQPERRVIARGMCRAAAQRPEHAHGTRRPRHQGRRQRHRLQPRRLPARARAHPPRLWRPDGRQRQLAGEQRIRRRRLHGRGKGRPAGHQGSPAGHRRDHQDVAAEGRRAAGEAARLLHRLHLPGARPAEVARPLAPSLAARGPAAAARPGRGREPGLADGLRSLAPRPQRRQEEAAEGGTEANSRKRLGSRRPGRPYREPDGAAGGVPRLGRVAPLRRQEGGPAAKRARNDPEAVVGGARAAGADLQGRQDGETEAQSRRRRRSPSRRHRPTTAS